MNKYAVFLIDDNREERKCRISSGWDVSPGSQPVAHKNPGMTLCSDGKNPTSKVFVRDVNPVSHCKVGLVMIIEPSDCESFFLKLYDGNNILWKLVAKEGYLYFEEKKTHITVTNKEYCIYTETDLEKGKTMLYVDDVSVGEFDSERGFFTRLEIGLDSYTGGTLEVKSTVCFAGYGICDRCYGFTSEKALDQWLCDLNSRLKKEKYFGDHNEFTYKLTAKNDIASVARAFDKTAGKICFELKYLTQGPDEKVTFSLFGDGENLVSVTDESTVISCCGESIRKRHENVWQTLRIEADTIKNSAIIKVNGKNCGIFTFDAESSFADRIKISYEGKRSLLFTDIFVYGLPEEPFDYVPEPVLPKKDGYTLGMNVCSLWRNGYHVGWDVISPFDDIQTYLGNYDEGLPEVADWETKWLAEHGVDFGLYCWYNNEVNAPLFKTGLSHALEDGYFNSKYSDKIKFAILWEALNCARAGEEGFRNHVVPYWMDHYFSDERYMTIDGKAVVSVFAPEYLIRDFGSPEDVKRQLDYVREKVKELGYAGAYFFACAGADEKIRDCGFDAVHAYSWGHYGYSKEYTKKSISDQVNSGIMHVIPTISTGFNDVAWGGIRYPQLKCDDMKELVSWVKNDILSGYTGKRQLDKTVIFSTWNEYGEGTYMMPSTLCGFGYLDEIRRGFTENAVHEDVIPTDAQLERLGSIFPKGHALLRNMQLEQNNSCGNEKVIKLELTPDKWLVSEGVELEFCDGVLKGKSSIFDPQMIYKGAFPADAASVRQIKLRMRADRNGGGDYVYFHYLTDCKGGGSWDMVKAFEADVKPDKIREYVFETDNYLHWNGNITAFRFDPLGEKGIFEVEAIELVCDESRPVIRIDGEPYKTPVSAIVSEEGVFVPLDHKIAKDFGIYCKWNRKNEKLYLEYNGTSLELKKNSDRVKVLGKDVYLERPLTFFDGLPMLSLDLICGTFGGTYAINDKFIDITYK